MFFAPRSTTVFVPLPDFWMDAPTLTAAHSTECQTLTSDQCWKSVKIKINLRGVESILIEGFRKLSYTHYYDFLMTVSD